MSNAIDIVGAIRELCGMYDMDEFANEFEDDDIGEDLASWLAKNYGNSCYYNDIEDSFDMDH